MDSRFAFSLDIAQVVDLGVKVGLELSEERLEELRKASEFGKLYQRALEWSLIRPRSRREIYDYLYKKVYEKKLDKKYIDSVTERLEERGYIDDRKFAEFWVENRFVKKGVAWEIIGEVLEGRDDEEEVRKMIAKKRGKYEDDEKLIAYLCRQGFAYDLVRRLVEEN